MRLLGARHPPPRNVVVCRGTLPPGWCLVRMRHLFALKESMSAHHREVFDDNVIAQDESAWHPRRMTMCVEQSEGHAVRANLVR